MESSGEVNQSKYGSTDVTQPSLEPVSRSAVESNGNGLRGTISTGLMNWKSRLDGLRYAVDAGQKLRALILFCIILLAAYALFMMDTRRPITSSLSTTSEGSASMPFESIFFQIVDRASFGDPASEIINESLFHPDLLASKAPKSSSALEGNVQSGAYVDPILKVPFPTGAFWTNLVMDPAANGFSYPVVAYPYAYEWSEDILQVSYPALRRRIDYYSIRDIVQPDLSLGVADKTIERHITSFDPLSVTLRFSHGNGYWESYLLHGSPYITTKYLNSQPVLKALSTFQKFSCLFDAESSSYSGVESIVDCSSRQNKGTTKGSDGAEILFGQQFQITTQEGLNWILISSECIGLSFNTRIRTEIVATNPFSGVLRLAFIPHFPPGIEGGNPIDEVARLAESTGVKALVSHANTYATGGRVSWDFKSSEVMQTTIGTIHFQYVTQSMNPSSKTKLLMLGLPHHADVLDADCMLSQSQFDLEYWSIKGRMTPVVGSSWSYDERLTNAQFDRVSNVTLDASVASVILQNIKIDMNLFQTTPTLNIYGYGKQAARLAQLAHITRIIAKQTKSAAGLLQVITERLQTCLVALLDGSVQDELLFDAKFGGTVSKNGLLNVNEDFGNGRYNDHHFHYGYLLYASAVMGSLNFSFVEHYGEAVDNLLYDIAYMGNADSHVVNSVFFPFARCKSWYDGHSFASGLFQQGNGKSQESSSEAVNGYYGGYLWSLVKHSVRKTEASAGYVDFLRLLLATEIRGVKTYWQMIPTQSSSSRETSPTPQRYNYMFTKNYMVGNLGMLDAVCSTYFASELFFVNLINIIPVTAITAEVFGIEFTSEQYANVIAKAEIPGAWKGYAVSNQALIDPLGAWEQSLQLDTGQMDSGISKSQVQYFISTLESFVSPTNITDGQSRPSGDQVPHEDTSNALCQDHSRCFGLTGLCCPTIDGIMLECC